jgi:hypothetical protein
VFGYYKRLTPDAGIITHKKYKKTGPGRAAFHHFQFVGLDNISRGWTFYVHAQLDDAGLPQFFFWYVPEI